MKKEEKPEKGIDRFWRIREKENLEKESEGFEQENFTRKRKFLV